MNKVSYTLSVNSRKVSNKISLTHTYTYKHIRINISKYIY